MQAARQHRFGGGGRGWTGELELLQREQVIATREERVFAVDNVLIECLDTNVAVTITQIRQISSPTWT